ncbi:MAG: creatininase family protein [Polyangiaceae bacterium]
MSDLLAELTTEDVRARLARGPVALILPVGSVEPHGPHLPLATDTMISERAAAAAVELLRSRGVEALVAPAIPYGVTDFAKGFAGAISLPGSAVTAFVRAAIDAALDAGFAHVCVVNNHLEPAQDAAVRGAIEGLGARASVACPLTRRWARTLSDEFKSGACHAGEYETALVLAARPDSVRGDVAAALGAVPVSLSEGIKAGKRSFLEMGMTAAYAGAPARATRAEGERLYALLAEMIATEVLDATRPTGG